MGQHYILLPKWETPCFAVLQNQKPRMHGPLRGYVDRYHITTRGFTCICNCLSALATVALQAPSLNRSVSLCGLPLVHKQKATIFFFVQSSTRPVGTQRSDEAS